MKIVLTSFRDAKNWKGTKCSIARWQPEWSNTPNFPIDVSPVWMGKSLGIWTGENEFRRKYELILKSKEEELIRFFSMIETDEPMILCCWCHLDMKKQNFNGKLFCHRILFGYWIERHFSYALVKYSDGAGSSIWERK